jgi:hypothetical protein
MSTANCYVDFWENKAKSDGSHDGGHIRFNGPVNIPDMSKYGWDGKSGMMNETDDSASSLATGSQSWLTVFSQSNYGGSKLSIGPGQTIPDLSKTNPNMDNTIASFQLFDAQPVNTSAVLDNFLALYPGSTTNDKMSGGKCIEWYAADSHYRIYYPSIVQNGTLVSFAINLDHIIGAGTDDHAAVTFTMDTSGVFQGKISITYDMSSGAYNVPQWMIDFADDAIDDAEEDVIALLDGAEIVFTAGAGVELVIPTDIFVMAGAELLTIAVNHINDVIDKLFGLSDNGGTMYFPSIVSHSVARMAYAFQQELYGQSPGQVLGFNEGSFLGGLGAGNWTSGQNKHNPCVVFTNNQQSYRCYYPDNTAGYSRMGYISTAKIDAINNNDKDDYMSVVLSFGPTGKLFSVQGSIDIYGAPDDSDDTDVYVAPSSGTIAYNNEGQIIVANKDSATVLSGYSSLTDAYRDLMQQSLNTVPYVDHDDFSPALLNIVSASCEVIAAIESAVS